MGSTSPSESLPPKRRGRAEHPDYPKNTEFKLKFGPRGVLRCTATTVETQGEDPRFGPWGKQNCKDNGPLDKKRMETVDQEFLDATLNFIDRANQQKKLFFAWSNSSRMHIWTRLKPESDGKTGLGLYPDGMWSMTPRWAASEEARRPRYRRQHHRDLHDGQRRRDIQLARWPHHPIRGENTNWEGSYRCRQ